MKKSTAKSKSVAKAAPKQQQVALLPEPKTMVELVYRASRDPNVDPGKLRELIALQQEVEMREIMREFDLELSLAQRKIPSVIRDAKNPETKSRYARLETISNAVDPVLREHDFSLSFGMAESNLPNHYRVVARLSRRGYTRTEFCDIPADTVGPKGNPNKTPTHGAGSAITYGRRYLKCLLLDINVVMDDDDGNTAFGTVPISDAQQQQIRSLATELNVAEDKLCEYVKIEKIEQANQPQVLKMLQALEHRRAEQARGAQR